MNDDPFAALGLPAWAELSDDDVRAAWRRVAAATHPDRDDGGDPARFGAAAAAYALLRTAGARGEALAELDARGRSAPVRSRGGARSRAGDFRSTGGQRGTVRWGSVLAVRASAAAAVSAAAFLAAGWAPSTIGVLAGALTWLLVSAGRALARRHSSSYHLRLHNPDLSGADVVVTDRKMTRSGRNR